MKKRVFWWQIAGVVFTVALGVLLHFVYDWSGGLILFASFSAVNESVWEHMKILFFPLLFFALIESFFLVEFKNFWSIKLKGILIGVILIPSIYYFFNGVIGNTPDWFNIAIFVISVGASFIYETKKFTDLQNEKRGSTKSVFILGLIAALFVIFTYAAPQLNIFKDPETNVYGINIFLNSFI